MAQELCESVMSATSTDLEPLPAQAVSLVNFLRHLILIWMIKAMTAFRLAYQDFVNKNTIPKPDLIRVYSCRPFLEVRIFLPKSTNGTQGITDDTKPNPPLYIDIHGGAFATCTAIVDDSFCKAWSQRTGMMVASLNYRKSPIHRFPVPVMDIAALARAVLEDETLQFDRKRVVLGGFSAGGTLALSACQLPELQHRIKAVVSFFPIVDWSSPPHVKFAERLYKDKASEPINSVGPTLDWAYVAAGQDRRAKLLSPCFAAKEELPEWVSLIGAQHDMLCREARDMIYSLAERKVPESGWDHGWESGSYKWMLVKGVRHGFTHTHGAPERMSEFRNNVCEQTYNSIHAWLEQKVFA